MYCSTKFPAGAGSLDPATIPESAPVPNPEPPYLAVFKAPPLAQVAAGLPAAFPKPFTAVPPDKNIDPSVKIAAVGGGKDHSSD